MTLMTPIKKAVEKTVSSPKFMAVENHAGLISGVTSIASDALLAGYDMIKNGPTAFNFNVSEWGHDQWISMCGWELLASSIPLLFSDAHPSMKKVTGGAYIAISATFGNVALLSGSPAIAVTSATYGIAGFSMVFENQIAKYAHKKEALEDIQIASAEKQGKKLSVWKDAGRRFINTCLEYPVVCSSLILTGGALAAVYAGFQDPAHTIFIPYGILGAIGYGTMTLLDDDLKQKLAQIRQRAPRDITPGTP